MLHYTSKNSFKSWGFWRKDESSFSFVPGMLVFAVTVDMARVDSAVMVMV